MWLVTKTGFYSIVHKPGDGRRLTIRSRVRSDLVALRREHLPRMSKIVEIPLSDYQFRATAEKRDVERAVAKMASEVDYPNFKDAVAAEQGAARSAIYHRVWAALLELERFAGRVWREDPLPLMRARKR